MPGAKVLGGFWAVVGMLFGGFGAGLGSLGEIVGGIWDVFREVVGRFLEGKITKKLDKFSRYSKLQYPNCLRGSCKSYHFVTFLLFSLGFCTFRCFFAILPQVLLVFTW